VCIKPKAAVRVRPWKYSECAENEIENAQKAHDRVVDHVDLKVLVEWRVEFSVEKDDKAEYVQEKAEHAEYYKRIQIEVV
jgi:hypothetical protein